MAVDRARITGLVLAGGKSSRMGIDKALLPLNGKPMIEWAIERLRPQVDTLLINSGDGCLARFGHPLVADTIVDQPGPLAGLYAGLQACATSLLVCVPCDAPLLPHDLVARLHAALGPEADVAVARTPSGLQPAFMLCRPGIAASIESFIASGRRALHQWLTTQRSVEVHFDDEVAFGNVNTPEDAAHIAKLLH